MKSMKKKWIGVCTLVFLSITNVHASTGSGGDISKVTGQLDKLFDTILSIFGSLWVTGFLAVVCAFNIFEWINDKNDEKAKANALRWAVGAGLLASVSGLTSLVYTPSSGSVF